MCIGIGSTFEIRYRLNFAKNQTDQTYLMTVHDYFIKRNILFD